MTAGMTLTGPANSSLEDPPYKRHHSLQREPCSPPPLSLAPPPPPPSYKLPADIELSKTEDGDGMEDDVEDISSASAHNHKNRQIPFRYLFLDFRPFHWRDTTHTRQTFYLLKIPELLGAAMSLEPQRFRSWELKNRFFELFFEGDVNWQLFFY